VNDVAFTDPAWLLPPVVVPVVLVVEELSLQPAKPSAVVAIQVATRAALFRETCTGSPIVDL
jgi:uncharacterized protein (DUF983 family)